MLSKINNNDDIKFFLDACGNFHDSCIVSMGYSSGAYAEGGMMHGSAEEEHILRIIFNSQLCSPFELVFTGIRKFSVNGWIENYFCDIFDCYLAFHDDICSDKSRFIVWADSESFSLHKETSAKAHSQNSFVIARELSWRFI